MVRKSLLQIRHKPQSLLYLNNMIWDQGINRIKNTFGIELTVCIYQATIMQEVIDWSQFRSNQPKYCIMFINGENMNNS